MVIGLDIYQRVWVLDAWADRAGTNTIVDNFVRMAVQWGPIICGFEDVGQQSLLVDPIMDKARALDVELPLTPVTVNTKVEKKWRIRALLQPVIGAGRLIIREDLVELKNEITSFPMNARMDMVDALATCVSLTPPVVSLSNNYDENRELARYLRETGVPMHEIEAQVSPEQYSRKETGQKWWHKLTKMNRVRGRS